MRRTEAEHNNAKSLNKNKKVETNPFKKLENHLLEQEKKLAPKKVESTGQAHGRTMSMSTMDLPAMHLPRQWTSISSKEFTKGVGEMVMCCTIDGTKDADYAFNIARHYSTGNNHLLLSLIYNLQVEKVVSYNNRRSTILDRFTAKLEKSINHKLVEEDKRSSNTHSIEQSLKLAESYSTDYFVCSYSGLKGQRGSNKEQEEGLNYLIKNARLPVIIVKEETQRNSWLIVMDKEASSTMKGLMEFLPLIGMSDLVHGVGFYAQSIMGIGSDVIQYQFLNNCKNKELRNVTYEKRIYTDRDSIHQQVKQIVNFGSTKFDYVVLFHDMKIYKETPPDKSYIANILKHVLANICFVKGG